MKSNKRQKSFLLIDIINRADSIARTAQRNGRSLEGAGFYATKFADSYAQAVLSFNEQKARSREIDDSRLSHVLGEIETQIAHFFNPSTNPRDRGRIRQTLSFQLKTQVLPAITKTPIHVPSAKFFPEEIVKGTRKYIEKVAAQSCGAYDMGWYDAAAVMARRLLETLIIELYEAKKLDHKIKKPDGTFHYLSGLISTLLSETAFNLGRNTLKALPKLKDLGDQSAHSRRYIARQEDLDPLKRELRIAVEELVHLTRYN